MFGITDPWIVLAYLLCILSTLFCVVYGILRWNTGDEALPKPEDAQWARQEDELKQRM